MSPELAALVLDPYEFAGDGTLLGIPHFWNVVTNAPFLLVGVLGLRRLCRHGPCEPPARFEWAGLWISTIFLAFSSGAYHWHPTPFTLALDRAGICGIIAFLGARAADVTFWPHHSRRLALGLLLGAELTVLLWVLGASAWIYGALQGLGGIAVLLVFLRAHRLGRLCAPLAPMMLFLGAYALAKVLEALDEPIWRWTGVLGGYPLKHLASAAGLLCLLPMMGARPAALPPGTR